MPTQLNIALVGGSAGLPVLRALRRTPHRVCAVIASRAANEQGAGISLAGAAAAAGLSVFPEARVKNPEFASILRELQVDLLLCIRTLYRIDAEVLEAPRIGSYNMHPGPLPEYAGRNVVSWAIYNGESAHGATVHRMERDVDAGPIAFESRFPIADSDTGLSVTRRAVREGVALLLRVVKVASEDPMAIPARPQDTSRRKYYAPGVPDDGRVRWEWSARRIHDFVRACDFHPYPSPWGAPVAEIRGRSVAVGKTCMTRAFADAPPGTVRHTGDGRMEVACSDEWLCVDELVVDGERHDAVQLLLKTGSKEG